MWMTDEFSYHILTSTVHGLTHNDIIIYIFNNNNIYLIIIIIYI